MTDQVFACGGSGKLTRKAVEEPTWFSRHLKEHPKAAPVEGCRFCDERVRLTASRAARLSCPMRDSSPKGNPGSE